MSHAINAAKGFFIGISLLIPGMSGGTMAIILGIYDDLIHAVSSFFKNVRANTILLFTVGAGAVLGIFGFSHIISAILERFEIPTIYFFMGVICGGIPVLWHKIRPKDTSLRTPIRVTDWVWGGVGLAIALLMMLRPGKLVDLAAHEGILAFVVLVIVGVFVAIALILPGISTTFFLLTLGLYERTLGAVKALDIAFLLPLLLGALIGTIATTKVLENLMQRHPNPTYLAILGFVVGSVAQVFPGIPAGWEILTSLLALAVGFLLMRVLEKKVA